MAGRTSIKKSPQVFLREIQLENDVKTLTNYHRLLHAWMAELRSASPTTQIGENGWTPRYIAPAHDKVVARILDLSPGFNHDTPILAASMPRLLPITVKENAVRIVSAGTGQQVGILLEKDGDWAQTLAAAFGQSELRIYQDEAHLPDDAALNIPAYHLVLMPVDEWSTEGAHRDIANDAYDKLMFGAANTSRGIQGRMVLRASVLPGMSRDEIHKAARAAASWAVSGEPLPARIMGGAFLPAAETQLLVEEGVRLFKRFVIPVADQGVIVEATQRIRARAAELADEYDLQGAREHAMREFVRQLAEELKT